MAARCEEGYYQKDIFTCSLVSKGLVVVSNDDAGGVARTTLLQEIRPGVGFKTGDFVNPFTTGNPFWGQNYLDLV